MIASNPNQSKAAAIASPQSQNATTIVSLDLQILVPSGWGASRLYNTLLMISLSISKWFTGDGGRMFCFGTTGRSGFGKFFGIGRSSWVYLPTKTAYTNYIFVSGIKSCQAFQGMGKDTRKTRRRRTSAKSDFEKEHLGAEGSRLIRSAKCGASMGWK